MQKVAAGLSRQGVAAGDRVDWLLPNCLEAVFSTLACYRLGAVSVPLHYRYAVSEVRYVLGKTRPALLIFHADREAIIHSLGDDLATLEKLVVGDLSANSRNPGWNQLLDGPALARPEKVGEGAPALILFTSGSTGRPKGVVHSHRGVFAAIDTSRKALDQYGLLASDLLDFFEHLEESGTRLPTLRNSIGSGDSVPLKLHHRFRDLFGWEMLEGCSMTDVGGYYAMNPRYGRRKRGSLGLPTPGTEMRIIRPADTDVGIGETGEISVRADSTTSGYWEDTVATAELYRDGWLHPGDLG